MFSCKKKQTNKQFLLLMKGQTVTLQILFLRGIFWWWKVEKHFSVLFSRNMAQLMNFMGLLIFPFKWGGRFSRHPRSKKTKLLHTWTWPSTSTRHATLKYPLLLQFPYCEMCNNENKQSDYRLMNVLFCTRALVADFSEYPE